MRERTRLHLEPGPSRAKRGGACQRQKNKIGRLSCFDFIAKCIVFSLFFLAIKFSQTADSQPNRGAAGEGARRSREEAWELFSLLRVSCTCFHYPPFFSPQPYFCGGSRTFYRQGDKKQNCTTIGLAHGHRKPTYVWQDAMVWRQT